MLKGSKLLLHASGKRCHVISASNPPLTTATNWEETVKDKLRHLKPTDEEDCICRRCEKDIKRNIDNTGYAPNRLTGGMETRYIESGCSVGYAVRTIHECFYPAITHSESPHHVQGQPFNFAEQHKVHNTHYKLTTRGMRNRSKKVNYRQATVAVTSTYITVNYISQIEDSEARYIMHETPSDTAIKRMKKHLDKLTSENGVEVGNELEKLSSITDNRSEFSSFD